MDPYEQGYDYCCNSDGPMDDNPHPIYSNSWYDWNEGYNDARYSPLDYLDNDDGYIDEDRPY